MSNGFLKPNKSVVLKRKGSNNMAFKIVGTISCRHTENEGWMAYVPGVAARLKTAIATGMARESEKLYVPLILTKSGIVPYQKRTEE